MNFYRSLEFPRFFFLLGFDSVPDIVEAMDNGEIQGALIDSYIAGEYQDDLKKYILQEILEHTFVYGVVLSRDAIVLENALRENIERRQSEIYNVIARAIKPLKVGIIYYSMPKRNEYRNKQW